MGKYVILIDSPDQKGLIYKVSKILFELDANIEENSEFVDNEHDKFFMRTEISGNIDIDSLLITLKKELPQKANIEIKKVQKKQIVILATKESHCLGDLLIRHDGGDLKADIECVISNHETLRPLCEKFGINYHFVPADNLKRAEHEQKVLAIIKEYNFDYIVLAKYMRILTPDFVEHFSNKIINIHHSFLPAFIGANPYKQAFNRGVKMIGATAHFVNNDLDEGPIIDQGIIKVDHRYSWQDMQRAGQDVEKIVLANALDLVLDNRVFVYANKTVIF
ncbi:MAG: formyltetrahydrofolate deformylase [Campylobacterales bacterium]|nr:formyltetrahydrofolate deformylase [Campylobacterales bacterium]